MSNVLNISTAIEFRSLIAQYRAEQPVEVPGGKCPRGNGRGRHYSNGFMPSVKCGVCLGSGREFARPDCCGEKVAEICEVDDGL